VMTEQVIAFLASRSACLSISYCSRRTQLLMIVEIVDGREEVGSVRLAGKSGKARRHKCEERKVGRWSRGGCDRARMRDAREVYHVVNSRHGDDASDVVVDGRSLGRGEISAKMGSVHSQSHHQGT
jgi:hypothetical protein